MKKLSLVVFDMDGLLIDSERGMWVKNEKACFEEMGYYVSFENIKSWIGMNIVSYAEEASKLLPNFNKEEFIERLYAKNKITIDNNEIEPMKGAFELLNFLKVNNIKMRVATSTARPIAEKILKQIHLFEYFEFIVCGDEISNGKPDPEIYNKAIGDINKDEVLVFEDGHPGSRAALASNAHLIIVPSIAYLSSEDKKEAYAVVDSLDKAIPIIRRIIENERATSF